MKLKKEQAQLFSLYSDEGIVNRVKLWILN